MVGASGPSGPDTDGPVVRAAHGIVAVLPAALPWTLSLTITASIAVDCGLENAREQQGLLVEGMMRGSLEGLAGSRDLKASRSTWRSASRIPFKKRAPPIAGLR